jgi:hypothetical protein
VIGRIVAYSAQTKNGAEWSPGANSVAEFASAHFQSAYFQLEEPTAPPVPLLGADAGTPNPLGVLTGQKSRSGGVRRFLLGVSFGLALDETRV